MWKSIKGYEGLYEISDSGEIKSLKYYGSDKSHLLKPCKNPQTGYMQVVLTKGKKHKTKIIHRMVAEHFLENPNEEKCVNHKDENKENNKVENLEWCSYSYNNQYNGRAKRIAKVQGKRVLQLDENYNIIGEFESTREAGRRTGFNQRHISECCNGKAKTTGGYIWAFADDFKRG